MINNYTPSYLIRPALAAHPRLRRVLAAGGGHDFLFPSVCRPQLGVPEQRAAGELPPAEEQRGGGGGPTVVLRRGRLWGEVRAEEPALLGRTCEKRGRKLEVQSPRHRMCMLR
jgi:hypothetical protein